MDSGNKETIYSDDDGEYGIYCYLCDKLAINRYYNNDLKLQTQENNFGKRQQIRIQIIYYHHKNIIFKRNIKLYLYCQGLLSVLFI